MSTAEADVKPASTESEMKRTWACHQCPSDAIEAIRRHQRPSEAIRGHQRPSEAIRGHQCPSEPIRGHQSVREVAYETAQMKGSHEAVRDPDKQ